jgi:MFS transporter, FSR family, fosmidomycin resistance protein
MAGIPLLLGTARAATGRMRGGKGRIMAIAVPAAKRDAAVITLVGAAHYSSHVMQLALPPLFPLLHAEFGASFTVLGLVGSLFYACSGFGQALAGVLVDRYGAHRLLLAGLVILSLGIGSAGLVASYWLLLPLAVIAGLGNSVFHPADLSILSHRVSESRLGRAYAVHGISGSLGYATSPVLVAGIAAYANWRVALIAVGLGGLAVAATLYARHALLVYRHDEAGRTAGARDRSRRYLGVIGTPIVLMAFGYFAVTAFAGSGMQTFSVTALTSGFGFLTQTATLALTGYLIGGATGMVLGGFLAERTRQHHRVAMVGIGVAALLMLSLTFASPSPLAVVPVMIAAGIANGITAPSRDVLVRRAAAGSGTGSVFGFVYSGFDLGSSTAPVLFGALLDHGAPRAVFLVVACAFALAVPTVLQIRPRPARPAQVPAGAD